jgi:phosphatidylinositol-4,5-bisphosphate 3-kinase
MPLLKLVEPEGNKEEKMVNSEIGLALGFSVHEFDEMKSQELVKFRRSIFQFVSDVFQVF